MVVILNELSMSGQFSQETFVDELPQLIRLFKVFDLLKFQLSKKSDFYNQKVFEHISFRDFVTQTRIDEVARLKSILVPITDAAPFWDIDPKHSCDDKYISHYTQDTCNYGLAESVEVDKIVFSFLHDQFRVDSLQLQKNTVDVETSNVYNLESFISFVFGYHPAFNFEDIVPDDVNKKDFFPNSRISNTLLNAESIEADNANLHQDERINNYKKAGLKIAEVNLWKYCQAATNKNDRDIFKRRIQTANYYLSIDTQHGRFEIFDNSGMHVGEYRFSSVMVANSTGSRSINI